MSEHSMACEYPEGCSCGASKSNDLQATVDRLRDQVRLRDLEADGVAIQFLALRRELEAVKADKERVNVIRNAEWITSPHDQDMSGGNWRLHFKPSSGGSSTAYGKTLLEAVENALSASAKENQGGAKTL